MIGGIEILKVEKKLAETTQSSWIFDTFFLLLNCFPAPILRALVPP